MYEKFTIDPTKKSNTFNPIEHINLLKLEDKFAFLDVFYNSCLPSFFPHSRLTVSNFFIQEYRASQSKNMLEYFEKDFKIPMLFPLRLSDYELIRQMAKEDNNMYNCPKSMKRGSDGIK
ncbi:hypothetical protein [Lactococcus lactis]|mgnify:CR=1 FL=1|uniref:hypothetical protein n=1 Tax=Lactococcus lactis TaxID=1358 RepID=UPI0015C352D1|nr:hypothetical protein [Lactococcus lactis]MCT0076690.1 hypothetical protein [Lactococcus lactis subsp. lactis]QLF89404.1 hypothetical protein HPC60_01155 [Lactococcus lactis subsp. lactis]